MATAFAQRERDRRRLDDLEIVTSGTDPAEAVHDGVVAWIVDVGFDLSDRTPRAVEEATLAGCDYVATVGCSTPTLFDRVDARDWALADPDDADPDRVREIGDTVEERVVASFDEIEADRP